MKRLALTLAILGLFSPLARADDGFTSAQRQQIIDIVRQALKSDPSILRDALTAFQADEDARAAAAAQTRIAANRDALFHKPGDPAAGDPSGDVTLVEFYDPRCPYCRRMLPAIESMVAHDPHLRVVYKDIPVLGPASELESRAIVAAQAQGGYLKMQQALMKSSGQPSEESIRDTAKSLGLDPDKLIHDMASPAVTQRLQANLELAHTMRVEGTPVFVVGQSFIPGAVTPEELSAAVAAARKHAS